jgi:hypothetical protein
MSENGFNEIATLECLNRPYDVRTVVMSMPDLGYGPGHYFWSGEAKLSKPTIGHVEVGDAQEKKPDSAKIGSNADGQLSSDGETKTEADDVDVEQATDGNVDSNEYRRARRKTENASYVCKSGMASLNMNGHTGFLTFATLYA